MESLFSHIACKLPLSANKDHCAGRLNETRLIDTVALFFFYNNRPDICDQILVGGPFAKQRPQVMVVLAEQAGAELALGGFTGGRGNAAKGSGVRGRTGGVSRRATVGNDVIVRVLSALSKRYV